MPTSYFVTFQQSLATEMYLVQHFLQSSDSAVEELLFLVFQPAICHADNVLVVRNFVSFHEFFQFRKQIEVAWSQDNAPDHISAVIQNAGFELLRHPPYSPFVFVLVKRVPNSRGNLRTVKTYAVMLVYRRNLVTLKV